MIDADLALAEPADGRGRGGRSADDDGPELAQTRRRCLSTWSITLSQTVGTPAEWVTPSSLKRRQMRSGWLSAQMTNLQPGHRRRVGNAPAVGVEHRHHGQHHRSGRKVEDVGRDDRHCVEHGRAVLVEHALRISGGAAGVAQAAGIALVAFVPAVIAVFSRKQARRTRRRSGRMIDRRQRPASAAGPTASNAAS